MAEKIEAKKRNFQWLTGEVGHPKLREHLVGATALMRAAPDWSTSKRSLQRSYPKQNENIPLALGDDE